MEEVLAGGGMGASRAHWFAGWKLCGSERWKSGNGGGGGVVVGRGVRKALIR